MAFSRGNVGTFAVITTNIGKLFNAERFLEVTNRKIAAEFKFELRRQFVGQKLLQLCLTVLKTTRYAS